MDMYVSTEVFKGPSTKKLFKTQNQVFLENTGDRSTSSGYHPITHFWFKLYI